MRPREILHFTNLTRGLICGCFKGNERFVRIQSTHCEHGQWSQIIHEVGAEFLYQLALGNIIIVHDKSERDRETRACWQGLSWLRYATQKAWFEGKPRPEYSRGMMPVNAFWEEQWKLLPRSTKHLLKHYKQYVQSDTQIIRLSSCYVRQAKARKVKELEGVVVG